MSKKTLILGGVFIVLFVLAFTYEPILKWKDSLNKPQNFLAVINFDKIGKMEINKDGNIIVLEKSSSGWKIANTRDFYINESLSGEIKTSLEKAIKEDLELVSNNKDNKNEFQTDESGVEISLFKEDEKICDFIVGRLGNDFSSTYVSQNNIEETYLVKADLYRVFNRDDWYDKTIFASDKDKISKIRFQYPSREFTIERKISAEEDGEKAGDWAGILPYEFNVSQEKAGKILNIMSNLSAAEIPEQNFENTGLEKHLIIIQASGQGIDNTLMIGKAEDEEELYYAKKEDSDNIYLIAKEQMDELDKTIKDLQ